MTTTRSRQPHPDIGQHPLHDRALHDHSLRAVAISSSPQQTGQLLQDHPAAATARVSRDCLRAALEILGLPAGALDAAGHAGTGHAETSENTVLLIVADWPAHGCEGVSTEGFAHADHDGSSPDKSDHPRRQPSHIWSERWIS